MSDKRQADGMDEVLILGVKGSGKTVFLAVLGHEYDQARRYGLNLRADSGTRDFAMKWYGAMSPDSGLEQRFPEATSPSAGAVELGWTVQIEREPLFRMRTLECGGETLVKAFREGGAGRGGGDEKTAVFGDGATEEEATIARLREMASRASVVCLFLNPRDFADERKVLAARYRHRMASAGKEEAARLRKALETAQKQWETNYRGMRDLAEAFLRNGAYRKKPLLFVLTQTGPDAEGHEGVREGIRALGGAMGYLLERERWLETEAGLEGRPAGAVAVSAVETVESFEDADGMLKERPRGAIEPKGLEEFLLMVGGVCCGTLEKLKGTLEKYRAAELARADAWRLRAGLAERAEASRAWKECGEAWEAEVKAYCAEHAGPRSRWRAETEAAAEGEARRARRPWVADEALRAKAEAAVAEGRAEAEASAARRGETSGWLEAANGALTAAGLEVYRAEQLWPDGEWLAEAVEACAAKGEERRKAFEEALAGGDWKGAERRLGEAGAGKGGAWRKDGERRLAEARARAEERAAREALEKGDDAETEAALGRLDKAAEAAMRGGWAEAARAAQSAMRGLEADLAALRESRARRRVDLAEEAVADALGRGKAAEAKQALEELSRAERETGLWRKDGGLVGAVALCEAREALEEAVQAAEKAVANAARRFGEGWLGIPETAEKAVAAAEEKASGECATREVSERIRLARRTLDGLKAKLEAELQAEEAELEAERQAEETAKRRRRGVLEAVFILLLVAALSVAWMQYAEWRAVQESAREARAEAVAAEMAAEEAEKAAALEAEEVYPPAGWVPEAPDYLGLPDEDGSPEECYEKGEDAYYGRNGTAKDYNAAKTWYRAAAAQGNADAKERMEERGWTP